MRTALALLFVSCVLPSFGYAQSSQSPYELDGVWQTQARDGSWGFIRFAPCADAYCGTLVGGGGADVDPQYFGTTIVSNMRWTGEEFTGGRLLDVETGRVYRSRMAFRSADQLAVSGCVLGGLICGGQTWTRVE